MDFFDKTFKTEDLLLQSFRLPWHRELVIGTKMLAEEVKEDLEALLQNFLNKYWTNIKALLRQSLNKYSTNIKLSFKNIEQILKLSFNKYSYFVLNAILPWSTLGWFLSPFLRSRTEGYVWNLVVKHSSWRIFSHPRQVPIVWWRSGQMSEWISLIWLKVTKSSALK